MNCEICGKTIHGKPLRTKIDGSVLEVCNDCAKFGRIQKEPPKPRRNFSSNKKHSKSKSTNSRLNIPRRRKDEISDEIVENFSIVVRNARESKGWTREKLGAKINEKVSVITRIESGKMEPDLKLAKKIEKTLNIKLIEKYDELDLEAFKSTSSSPNTLGSIVKIKRK